MTINQLYFISEIFSKYRYDHNFAPMVAPTQIKTYFEKIEPLPILLMIFALHCKIDSTFCLIYCYDEYMRLDHSFYKDNNHYLLHEMHNVYNVMCCNSHISNLAYICQI